VDLTHRIPPFDIRAGSLTLWRCAPWLRDCVVLAVVDPGVGTARRPVAVEVAESDTVLVGPDNGLLVPAAHALGELTRAVELRPPPARPGLPPPEGSTFDGRDLFAPVAGRIATGEWDLEDTGDRIDPSGLSGGPVARPVRDPDASVRSEVLWVDRFGNAQLSATPADVAHLGETVTVSTGSSVGALGARRVKAFGELRAGELGLVTDSYGMLALAFNAAPAAAGLGIKEGDSLRIGPAQDG
jgi:S-adenosyl-L-methionine hydrolase (adenosine-forming)